MTRLPHVRRAFTARALNVQDTQSSPNANRAGTSAGQTPRIMNDIQTLAVVAILYGLVWLNRAAEPKTHW